MSARPPAPRRHRPAILVFLLLALAPGAGGAAAQDYTALLAPDPAFAAAAALPLPLGLGDLEDLALRASGLGAQALPKYRQGLDRLCSSLVADLEKSGAGADAGKRAEAALGWLHDTVFKSYSLDSTTIDAILDRGRFNCVSSAVLYLVALRALDIRASGVKTADHAFVVVHLPGRDVDVETTNRYGFDPGSKKEFSDSFGKATGYSYVPPGNYHLRTVLGERELVALVISNRIAMAEQSRDFRGALPMAADFAALMGATPEGQVEGRKLLLDCVNNLAVGLQDRRDWGSIVALAEAATEVLGRDPRLDELAGVATYNSIAPLLDGAGWKEALSLAESAYRDGRLKKTAWTSLVEYGYGNAAQRLGREGDWLGGSALATEGAARLGGSPALDKVAETCRRNFAVVAHNRFATLYNKGDYAGAAKAAQEALAALPGDRTLTADLAAARKAQENR